MGASVSLSLGGRLDRANAAPLPVTGRVARLDPPDAPTLAVLQVQGVTVLLQATRDAFDSPRSFARTGVDPMRQKIVVVKLGYLFPQLRDVAPRSILALSPGFTDLQLPRLPYRNIRRPVYPLDQAADWRPADAMGPTG